MKSKKSPKSSSAAVPSSHTQKPTQAKGALLRKEERGDYLHGYSDEEQNRLYQQATFLESWVYQYVDLKECKSLLEVGSGVGAQTAILLRRYPEMTIHCVDASAAQLARAGQYLKEPIKKGRVTLQEADASHLPFASNTFDGAFLCWFLEHVQDPEAILREVRRTLRSGALIYCSEVQNASLFLEPYSPGILKYWFEFNDLQWCMKGDPFVGGKLGNLLLNTGFQQIETQTRTFHFDSRTPKQREEFLRAWTDLLLSGAPALLKAGRVDEALIEQMKSELQIIATSKESVFFYSFIQACARAL